MNRSIFETVLGMMIISIAIFFAVYAYSFTTDIKVQNMRTIKAHFNQSGGLNAGADVRMAGVKIGKVLKVSLDNEQFLALVEMSVQKSISLPQSTVAEIASSGLVGGKYVRLVLKDKDSPLLKNDTLENTKSVETLEQLLGKIIFLTKE